MSILQSQIQQRLDRNKNAIVVITGDTGSGKSWASMTLGETFDHNFWVDRIFFSPLEFVRALKRHAEGLKTGDQTKLIPKGAVLVVEEAGTQYSNRAWQTINNKLISIVAQSFRSFNWIIIFNVPNFDYFDKQAREQTHYYLEAKDDGIDFIKETAEFKLRFLRKDHFTGDISKSWISEWMEDGSQDVYINIEISKPQSMELINEYEKKKQEWQIGEIDRLFDELTTKTQTKIVADYENVPDLVV